MDRWELARTLAELGAPDALYRIPGVHEPALVPDAYHFLRQEDDRWVVGINDRAQDLPVGDFATEDAACRWLLDTLVRQHTASAPAGDVAEGREAIRRGQREQRTAWEQSQRSQRGRQGRGRDSG